MTVGAYTTIKLTNGTEVKIERGCSFENNGNIYRVNNDGKFVVYDKERGEWVAGTTLEMRNYQLNVFKAVANNNQDKENGRVVSGIVLSKADIDAAIALHRQGKLTYDLDDFIGDTYEFNNVQRHEYYHGFSAHVTNNQGSEANLIFKYGTQVGAVILSREVNNSNPLGGAQSVQSTQAVSSSSSPSRTTSARPSSSVGRVSNSELPEFYNVKLNSVADKLGISREQLNSHIANTARKTGYSEYFISHLVSMEHFEPLVKNTGDGTLTGGFGHTKLRDRSLREGQTVTAEDAFKWLASDIEYFEGVIKDLEVAPGKRYGDYFDQFPPSMREGLIDVAFNRDARKLQTDDCYASLRANILAGPENYPAAAVRIRQNFRGNRNTWINNNFTTGLMERNVYRFLLAVRDFEPHEIEAAKRRFENDGYYADALWLKEQKGYVLDAQYMRRAWDSL